MGKVEKVIVLSVLFLVALILVVTITVDDPLDKTNVVEAGAKKGAPAVAQQAPPPAANPLLNATVQPPVVPPVAPAVVGAANTVPVANTVPAANTGAAATPTPAATPITSPTQPNAASMPTLPPGALLKRVDGLQDSWFADLKLYTWKEGDSWRAIANTYYGDWQRTDLLKRHNEGRMDVEPGETVFIPVFASERTAQTPNTAGAGSIPMTAAVAKDTAAKKAAPASTPTGKKIHVVANGESLWKIAKAELGDGNRWKEIYEANRDVLAKPESIRKGMRLRIP